MFGEELWRQRPGGVAHHFVHVAAMSDGVVALVFIHDREALELVRQVVTADFKPEQQM